LTSESTGELTAPGPAAIPHCAVSWQPQPRIFRAIAQCIKKPQTSKAEISEYFEREKNPPYDGDHRSSKR